jgi:hypothetical protein
MGLTVSQRKAITKVVATRYRRADRAGAKIIFNADRDCLDLVRDEFEDHSLTTRSYRSATTDPAPGRRRETFL